MIYSVQNFFGVCNKCDKIFGDSTDDSMFDDEDDLIELMIDNGWEVVNVSEVYCSMCKKEIKKNNDKFFCEIVNDICQCKYRVNKNNGGNNCEVCLSRKHTGETCPQFCELIEKEEVKSNRGKE